MSEHHDPRERDPRFPDRPTHEDFVILSEVLQDNDFRAETLHQPPFEIAEVDERSLLYLVENRLAIVEQRTHRDLSRLKSLLTAMYLDAFVLGKRYAERKRT